MRAFLVVALVGCTAASSDPGLDALLQVQNAQFRPGPFPAEAGGPMAYGLTTQHNAIVIGETGESLRGVLDSTARGAVIGIDGIDGTWLIAAGPADLDTPGNATAKATFGVGDEFPSGPFTLRIAGSDDAGRFGPSATTTLLAKEAVEPQGELVFGLHWDSSADLDIHVVDPMGGEAWSDDPNTWVPPPPGEPVDPTAFMMGGILDHDGNKKCNRDARPNEHVVWTMPPPAGEYIVRVDARSMCGDASAGWRVEVYRNGVLLGEARGVAVPEDAQQQHGAGAGVLALRLAIQ